MPKIRLNQCVLLVLMLCYLCLNMPVVQARWTLRPRRTTTTTSTTTARTPHRRTTVKSNTDRRHQHIHHWPPLVAPPVPPAPPVEPSSPPSISNDLIRLIDSYDNRALDGNYEYRYELSNGDTRYERAYWLPVGERSILARKGYYSIPLPNSQYSTVFYTADHRGYHVDMHTLSSKQPLLPRSLKVPTIAVPSVAKPNSISSQKETHSQPEEFEPMPQHAVEPETETEFVPKLEPESESMPHVDASQLKIELPNAGETETKTETQPSNAVAKGNDEDNIVVAAAAAADDDKDENDDDDDLV